MKRVLAFALIAGVVLAHTGDKKLPPSKAAKDLKRAKQLQKEGKTEEFNKVMLACKRTMAAEGRYACCIKGGCNECAYEMECACGKNLATKNGKGVCKECYAGWQTGRGSFEGIKPEEVAMSEMSGSMTEGMSPEVETSGIWLSGTAQSPRDTPRYMTHLSLGNWSLMTMAQGHLLYTAQSGPRGADKLFSPNWIMPMLTRRLGRGQFTIRSMFSLEPATVTNRRYPLLFQAGETAFGQPIKDGQHPHTFFMELGASYVLSLSDKTSLTFYGGPRGEPALGPSAFPHRMSQSENPIAVLGHHYQDSTHIANNVVTMGITHGKVTLEASGFNGREPDENYWKLQKGKIDSYSMRLTVTPTSRWSVQFSGASLTSPEELHPTQNSVRLTSSVQYVRPLERGHWASMVLWGQSRSHNVFNSYVAESTMKKKGHWVWGRLEYTDKDATLAGLEEEDHFGNVTALTAGYGHDLPKLAPWLSTSLGGQMMFYFPSAGYKPFYGSHPVGAQVFLRARLVGKDQ